MTASDYPYPYRVRKDNTSGISYALTHFRRLDQAKHYVAEFLSPTSSETCSPRRGYPYSKTIVYLEERVSWSTWRVIGTFSYAAA